MEFYDLDTLIIDGECDSEVSRIGWELGGGGDRDAPAVVEPEKASEILADRQTLDLTSLRPFFGI